MSRVEKSTLKAKNLHDKLSGQWRRTELQELMNIAEAAQRLKISRTSLYKFVQSGRIPAVKIGDQWRFSPEALEAWIAERAVANVSR